MENNFLRKSKNILMLNKIKIKHKESDKVFYFKDNNDLARSSINLSEYNKSDVKLTNEQDTRLVILNRHLLQYPEALKEVSLADLCMFVETGFISPNVGHGLDNLSSQYETESKEIFMDGVKKVLKDVRKEKENVNILINDHLISVSKENRDAMLIIHKNFELKVYDKVDFKTEDGYISDLTKAQLEDIMVKTNTWVNDAYKSESNIIGTLEKMSLKNMVDRYAFTIGNDGKINFEITDEISYYYDQIFSVFAGTSEDTLEELEEAYLEHKKDEEGDGDKDDGDGDTNPPPIDPPKVDTPLEDETTTSGDGTDSNQNTAD
ncbi:MAG: hypothetical protein K2M73_08040 [Lachnospiraceae bacterium]|nr:hypothetical protein [Lachnospiraceae bacterium]